jgi:hypothetical protein
LFAWRSFANWSWVIFATPVRMLSRSAAPSLMLLPVRFGSQLLLNETSTGSSITFLYPASVASGRA